MLKYSQEWMELRDKFAMESRQEEYRIFYPDSVGQKADLAIKLGYLDKRTENVHNDSGKLPIGVATVWAKYQFADAMMKERTRE
jgi:hypothetical protein